MADAVTINAGSITGIRNRSCGKNRRPAITVESAINQSAIGGRPRRQRIQAPAAAGPSSATYGIADAAKYFAECSLYDGPIGTTV